MNRAQASRKNARWAGFVTQRIKRYKKEGLSHEEAREKATADKNHEKAKREMDEEFEAHLAGATETIDLKR